MKIYLSEKTISVIAAVLANCIEHICYNEDGDHVTLTQDFQNLVKAKEEFVEEAVRQGVLKEII